MTAPVLPLSDQARLLLAKARCTARQMGQPLSGPAHIIMSVSKNPRTSATYVLELVGVDPAALAAAIRTVAMESHALPSEDERRVVERAMEQTSRGGRVIVCADDLLVAALELAGPVVRSAFEALNISLDNTATNAQQWLSGRPDGGGETGIDS